MLYTKMIIIIIYWSTKRYSFIFTLPFNEASNPIQLYLHGSYYLSRRHLDVIWWNEEYIFEQSSYPISIRSFSSSLIPRSQERIIHILLNSCFENLFQTSINSSPLVIITHQSLILSICLHHLYVRYLLSSCTPSLSCFLSRHVRYDLSSILHAIILRLVVSILPSLYPSNDNHLSSLDLLSYLPDTLMTHLW
jgi:hypothetical protein